MAAEWSRSKSLCFQVPAVADDRGLTLVVSPLLCESTSFGSVDTWRQRLLSPLALMKNQVQALKSYGVKAEMLSGKTPKDKVEEVS